jgi:hypothetical protein
MKRHFRILAALVAAVAREAVAQEIINGSRQINGGISIAATAGVGGVTAKLLASKDASNPTAYVIPTSGGCGSGIAATTVSAGASFQLYVVPGLVLTGVADNTITAGHILTGGTSTPGRVRDSGQTSRGAVDSLTCIVGVAQESKTVGQDVLFRYDGVGTYGQSKAGTVAFTIDGGGSTITNNSIGYRRMTDDCTLGTYFSIMATGASPTFTVDVFKVAVGTALPTSSIISSSNPALSTGNAVVGTTAWTNPTVTADDIIAVKVTAVTNATWAEVRFKCQ